MDIRPGQRGVVHINADRVPLRLRTAVIHVRKARDAKGNGSDVRHAVRNRNAIQVIAGAKRPPSDIRQAGRQRDTPQTGTTLKRRFSDACHAGRDCIGGRRSSGRIAHKFRQVLGKQNAVHVRIRSVGTVNRNCLQRCAILERIRRDARHAGGKADACQACAALKRLWPYAARKRDARQAVAAEKRLFTDVRDAGKIKACGHVGAEKRLVADARYAGWNRNVR